jgi:hypothetical protein
MQGRTAEAETGDLLPFVAIRYTSGGVARSSASDGDARFNVPADPGTVVRFVAVGRVPVEIRALPAGAPSSPRVVAMRESTTELSPLEIVATRPKGFPWLAVGAVALLALLAGSKRSR